MHLHVIDDGRRYWQRSIALVCDIIPPLELTNGYWCVGLLDFTTYNSIPNIIDRRNNVFPVQLGNEWKFIKFAMSAYEVNDIESYLKKTVKGKILSLRLNNNTLKCELHCSVNVDFSRSQHKIGRMLEFTRNTMLERIKRTRRSALKRDQGEYDKNKV